jgi:hypothetical protein
MTREETQERIEVMQHYADGGEVEFFNIQYNTWYGVGKPSFSDGTKYRIKPDTEIKDALDSFFNIIQDMGDYDKKATGDLFETLAKKFKP